MKHHKKPRIPGRVLDTCTVVEPGWHPQQLNINRTFAHRLKWEVHRLQC